MRKYVFTVRRFLRLTSYVTLSAVVAVISFVGIHKKADESYTLDYSLALIPTASADHPTPTGDDYGGDGDGGGGPDGDGGADSC